MATPSSAPLDFAALPPALLCAAALVSAPERRAPPPAGRPALYVCLPTEVKSTVLEHALQTKLPALAVTVFGRFRDFEEALAAKRPDAVLALEPLLAHSTSRRRCAGSRTARSREARAAVGGRAAAGDAGERTIGVVDFLGREETQTFVAG